jgi:hypothetical protein
MEDLRHQKICPPQGSLDLNGGVGGWGLTCGSDKFVLKEPRCGVLHSSPNDWGVMWIPGGHLWRQRKGYWVKGAVDYNGSKPGGCKGNLRIALES